MIFTDWYLPAFKGGGPIQSIVNLVERFKDRFDFHIVTGDRDLNDTFPFPNIHKDVWLEMNGYHICYRSPEKRSMHSVRRMLADIKPDIIYLNSMFSDMYKPLLLSGFSGRVIVAPRGMLRPSALSVKPLKKFLYLWCIRVLLLDRKLNFHATGDDDVVDIKRTFPHCAGIFVAPNLPSLMVKAVSETTKVSGTLRLVTVGRMHPIKNFIFLLKLLEEFNKPFELDIIATREDQQYLEECIDFANRHLMFGTIRWHLDLPNTQVHSILANAHLFVSPTKGENFGHAIFESLSSGCPVLISDQTPWKNLPESKAGFDLSLESTAEWISVLDSFAGMTGEEWKEWMMGARNAADSYLNQIDDSAYLKMFRYES